MTAPSPLPDSARQSAIVQARARHWRRLRRLTAALMAVWLVSVFLTIWFARELAQVSVFGWPLSFYFAAQGSGLIYLAVIGAYARRARHYDDAYRRELT